MDKVIHSHIFTNKNGNTLMREFEGVLSNNPTIKNLDAVVGFPKKMLTATLKTLTEDGLVARKLYPAVPPKVEYSLTERGRSLLPHLDSLISWAIENFDAIISNRSIPT